MVGCWMVGWMSANVFSYIAVLYQAGKLAHSEVGLLGCLYSGKRSSYSIHDGDRNRLWPQETFIRYYYEEKAWKQFLGY